MRSAQPHVHTLITHMLVCLFDSVQMYFDSLFVFVHTLQMHVTGFVNFSVGKFFTASELTIKIITICVIADDLKTKIIKTRHNYEMLPRRLHLFFSGLSVIFPS